MKVFADLHLHSKYSRATSKDLNLANIAKYGKIKGLNLIGTADFTHPLWLKELKNSLFDNGNGIYTYNDMNFVLSVEISLIYSQDGAGRRIHHIILAPNFDIVDQINEWFSKKGRLDYDGRPIFGFNSIELVENLMSISKEIEVIPAHIYTPWFSLFGSNSGFNSIKECFGDQLNHIHAIETGLSSDPEMCWRISELDDFSILSFSDAHSHWPWRLGRECCLFDMKNLTYNDMIEVIRDKDKKRFLMTLEFFPEEGKYHYDGHRNCNICFHPKETKKHKSICPKCGKQLVIGVLNRVEELADRPEGYRPKNAVDFKRLVPLHELIAFSVSTGLETKKVWDVYNRLVKEFGNEFNVLLDVEKNALAKHVDERLLSLLMRNREGKLRITPGYDGVYGRIEEEKQNLNKFLPKKL